MSGTENLSCDSSAARRYLPFVEIPKEGISLEAVERQLIEIALRQTLGNQTRAARLLRISRDTLRYRINKFGLAKEFGYRFRGSSNGTDVATASDAPALSRS